MFRFPLVLASAAILAACEGVPIAQPSSQPAPQSDAPIARVPSTFDQPARGSRDARAIARDFVVVQKQVEPVAEQECRRRAPGLNCDFKIVVDDRADQQANAFQTVDGEGRPIIVFTLALLADARNRDEIAFVMSHEAAHHIEGHLEAQQRNAILGAEVFGQLAGVFGADSAEAVETAQEIGALVGSRTYSQEFELEADALGTIITALAGFDPIIGAGFFNRLPDPGDTFLGTHPPNAQRIATVERVAAGL